MASASAQFDVIVLGAGAAGLFAAATAGQRGRKVLILEHNAQPGRKILVSGGGRCNFTNLDCGPANYLSENPHFAKSALAQFRPQHFLEILDRYGIAWHEKTLGQLFCDESARGLLDALLTECERDKVEIHLNASRIAVESNSGGFDVVCSAGEFRCESLIVATGGLSIPKLGATGLGYQIARQFGLEIVPTRPALVPLTLSGDDSGWTALSGLAAEVEARAGGKQFREMLLFTHRGLSGPAVLQASSYWRPGQPLEVDFAPGLRNLLAPLLKPRAIRDLAALRKAMQAADLPQRLVTHLAEAAAPAKWTNAGLDAAERLLHHWSFHPSGTEGYAKAEVTAGGVSTACLNSKTMEAKARPGLFFVGEVVDVTGWLGGYNFQWAWASAAAAGRAV